MPRKCIVCLLLLFSLFSGYVTAEQPLREIVVNIPSFTLYLYEDGVVIKEYSVSIGNELKPSVLGETTIINKVIDPTYYPPNAVERGLSPIPPGPSNPVGTRWLGLGFPSYGIHGTNNPSSIGKAASSGCLRMNNHDVEELASLVEVGTLVRLIYKTVLMQEDPLLGHKTITVYPDIYNQGVTQLEIEHELKTRGWDNVFWSGLEELIVEAAGSPRCLPLKVPIFMNQEQLDVYGVRCADRYYLPYDVPLERWQDGLDMVVQWGSGSYLPVEQYAQITGFSSRVLNGAVVLQAPQAYLGDIHLGDALFYHDIIYVPVKNIPGELMTNGQLVPEQVSIILFNNDYYLPEWIIKRYAPDAVLFIETDNEEP